MKSLTLLHKLSLQLLDPDEINSTEYKSTPLLYEMSANDRNYDDVAVQVFTLFEHCLRETGKLSFNLTFFEIQSSVFEDNDNLVTQGSKAVSTAVVKWSPCRASTQYK